MANKKYTLYFKGTNKYGHKYELPIAVADSVKELHIMTGIPIRTISTSISLGRPYYYKIDVSDEQ